MSSQDSLSEKWKALAKQARLDAETLPERPERVRLLKYADQLDVSVQMNDGLTGDQNKKPRPG